MKDKYPRVTSIQVELWLQDPVTKALLVGYKELSNKIDKEINTGQYIDSSNNDLSMNQLHTALGIKQGFENASKFEDVLRMCEFIEVKDEGKKI